MTTRIPIETTSVDQPLNGKIILITGGASGILNQGFLLYLFSILNMFRHRALTHQAMSRSWCANSGRRSQDDSTIRRVFEIEVQHQLRASRRDRLVIIRSYVCCL